MPLPLRAYGNSGLFVSVLGLGTGALGDERMSEGEAERLLHGALDAGVTLLDTAPSYGVAEERIGRFLGPRREGVVLSTKGGYGVPGVEDWTPAVVEAGIDAALRRLRTDRIDVFHLHSCPRETLERDGLLEALERARRAGKIRVAAYSGENDALAFAAEAPVFGGLQCSINVWDQRSLARIVPRAVERGLGVFAKRPLANFAFRHRERPRGDYGEPYWERGQAMALPEPSGGWAEATLRFAAFAPGVTAVLAGTSRLEHLAAHGRSLEKGPLDPATVARFEEAFARNDRDWSGQV